MRKPDYYFGIKENPVGAQIGKIIEKSEEIILKEKPNLLLVLGEPKDKSLVLRTSIIGPEIAEHVSLLDWFKQQEGKTINSFANHFWNGITTKQFGKICDEIISNPEKYPKTGLYHIFSTTVSKSEMLLKFKENTILIVRLKKTRNKK